MKKILFSLLLVFMICTLSFSETIYALIDMNYAFLKKSEAKTGTIILKEIKDSREKDEGQGDMTFLGNVRIKNYGIPTPFRSQLPIDYTYANLISEALGYAGFNVAGVTPDNKNPILAVELLDTYFDGMMVYGLSIKYKVTLLSPDGNKTLFSKVLSSSTACFLMGPQSIESAFNTGLNSILQKTALTFVSSQFIEAYHGRAYNEESELADYSKKKLSKIPDNIPNPENIRVVSFYKNDISKISNLDKLTNLEELDLSSNDIKSIDNLNNNTKLKSISLSGNKLDKIANIDNLVNLTDLNLNNMDIKKIENLDKLKNLQWLVLSNNNKIKKIEGVENLSNLLWFNLHNTNISKIENLDNLKNLIWLNLNTTDITKIENLSSLSNLIYLDFNYCISLKKIESLNKLTNLEYLNISNTGISKLENMDDLVHLRKLKIGNCPIEKIEGINNLTNLEELYITKYFATDMPSYTVTVSYGKTISKIENIENLINLKILDISGTDVSKVENIDMLTNLRVLNIAGTKINKIENINSLVNLEKIDISFSKIKKLENLENLKNLNWINIRNKQIKEISDPTYKFLKAKDFKLEGKDIDSWIKNNFIKIIKV